MCANTDFHKRAILLIFYTEYAESVLDCLSYPEPTIGPPWLGPEKNIQNRGSQKARRRYFQIGFCKYSKFFLQLYVLSIVVQICAAFKYSKIT